MKNYITNSEWLVQKPLTTITYSDLVFCLEHRSVTVHEKGLIQCKILRLSITLRYCDCSAIARIVGGDIPLVYFPQKNSCVMRRRISKLNEAIDNY